MPHKLKWFADRAMKWIHDSLIVVGSLTVFLTCADLMSDDFAAELRGKWNAQFATK